MEKKRLGEKGERLVVRYLVGRLGYRVVGRNIRLKFGEIDILAYDPVEEEYVVVEVRSRVIGRKDMEYLGESVVFPRHKINRLKGLARYVAEWKNENCRVDLYFVGFESEIGGLAKPVLLRDLRDVLN